MQRFTAVPLKIDIVGFDQSPNAVVTLRERNITDDVADKRHFLKTQTKLQSTY